MAHRRTTRGGEPANWLAALRGLGRNPARALLLQARRVKRRPWWLSGWLVLGAALAGSVWAACWPETSLDWVLSAGQHAPWLSPPALRWAQLVLGLPLLLWVVQGLYCWAEEALDALSTATAAPAAVPAKLAEELSAPELLLGTLSALLSPVLWRVLGALAWYSAISPWPSWHYAREAGGWPPLERYLSPAFPAGVLWLGAGAVVSATTLSCLLLVAGWRGWRSAERTALALAVPLSQMVYFQAAAGALHQFRPWIEGYQSSAGVERAVWSPLLCLAAYAACLGAVWRSPRLASLTAVALVGLPVVLAGLLYANWPLLSTLALLGGGCWLAQTPPRSRAGLVRSGYWLALGLCVVLTLAAAGLTLANHIMNESGSAAMAPRVGLRLWSCGPLLLNPAAAPDPQMLLFDAHWYYPPWDVTNEAPARPAIWLRTAAVQALAQACLLLLSLAGALSAVRRRQQASRPALRH